MAWSLQLPSMQWVEELKSHQQFGHSAVSLDNHNAVQRVKFYLECPATLLLGVDHGRAAAAAEVEDVLAGAGRVLHRAHSQFYCLPHEWKYTIDFRLIGRKR